MNVERYYEIKERNQELKKLFSMFSEEEQIFIDLYFGFGFQYHEPVQYNQKEIAKILGVSPSKVSKMKKKILNDLKENFLLQKQIEEEHLRLSFTNSKKR